MVTSKYDGRAPSETPAVAMVDPRAPRFGQAITASVLLAGVLLDLPALVFAIAVVLGTAVLSGWRYDLYGVLFKRVLRPRLEPRTPEPATPHRFAKLLGAVGSTVASVLLVVGFPLAGYGIAVAVAAAAGLAATTGFCLGCRMYRQVSYFRRLSIV